MIRINGLLDPLRKTLIIIDEAHKLYGGGDLSSVESPDMYALHSALMNSYIVSGQHSVKILLMTATPIQNDPMELIKLINLCKTPQEQMPSNITKFMEEYLDNEGFFTVEGKQQYLSEIAGHVSYLNREKDARQFAQPVIQFIYTPLVSEEELRYNKKTVSNIQKYNIKDVKTKIDKVKNELNKTKKKIRKSTYKILYNLCDNKNKQCKDIVKNRIEEEIADINEKRKHVEAEYKVLKKELDGLKIVKNTNKNIDGQLVRRYANSIYNRLTSSCKTIVKDDKKIIQHLANTDIGLKWGNKKLHEAVQNELGNLLQDGTQLKVIKNEYTGIARQMKQLATYLRKQWLKVEKGDKEDIEIDIDADKITDLLEVKELKKEKIGKMIILNNNKIEEVKQEYNKKTSIVKHRMKDSSKILKEITKYYKNLLSSETKKINKTIKNNEKKKQKVLHQLNKLKDEISEQDRYEFKDIIKRIENDLHS